MELMIIVLSEKIRLKKEKDHVFSHMWNLDFVYVFFSCHANVMKA